MNFFKLIATILKNLKMISELLAGVREIITAAQEQPQLKPYLDELKLDDEAIKFIDEFLKAVGYQEK